MKRLTLTVVAAALGSLLALSPALAQETPDPPGTGEITGGSWAGSQFDDADMRAGDALRTTASVTVSGRFEFKQNNEIDSRKIDRITASATDPQVEGCSTPQVGEVTTDPAGWALKRSFSFTISSACNISTEIQVRAKTNGGNFAESRTLSTVLTFAAPSQHPATDVAAEVEDTDDREVDISWAFPEETEPDTTYVVQRLGPDPDEDMEWVDVSDELTTGDDPSLTDDVTTAVEDGPVTGAYKYRVIAVRPHADAATIEDEVAEVYVGVPPATTTTTTPTSSTVTQPRSATTITIPRLGSSQTPNRNSTHTTVTPQGPPTTIDTGFEETLDYGDRLEDSEPGELAAEGQSIISADDESVVGPGAVAASLMVLFGWAGHVVYFRRLAAQF